VDETVGFRDQTGGFDLLGIDRSERLHIEFRVKEKASPTTAVGKIDVTDADPALVTSFGLRAIPPGMTAADMNIKIDAATRARVIDGVVANLNEFYVYPESAKKMEEALRQRQKKIAYDAAADGEKFAACSPTICSRSATISTCTSCFPPRFCRKASPSGLPMMKRGCEPSWNATTVPSRRSSGSPQTSVI
jgi:hypothetical protein